MADQGGGTSNDTTMLLLAGVFLLITWVIWVYAEFQIKDAFRWVRYAEMKAISFLTPKDYTLEYSVEGVDEPLAVPYDETVERVSEIRVYCDTEAERTGRVEPPTDRRVIAQRESLGYCLNDGTVGFISWVAMEPLRYPVSAILLGLGIWALMYGPKAHNRRKLDIDGLIYQQAKNFPAISPFKTFNPSEQPPRPPGSPVPAKLPLFAEALGPEEWIAFNSIPTKDGELDKAYTCRIFARQLGKPWQGAAKLDPYKQVLLAAFCLKAARKRSEADDMLGRLATCWSSEKGLVLDESLVKKARSVLGNKSISSGTLAVCNQHAYQTTALMRALAKAREDGGVLAPSQFVWLRAYNRDLWYPLNNLGRQSYHMEALGAMAHYKIEKMVTRPVPKPRVEGAFESISNYMNSPKARPLPQLEYEKSGGRAVKRPAAVKKPAGKK